MPGQQRPHTRISKKGKAFRAGHRADFGARKDVRVSFKKGLPSSRLGKAMHTDRIAISAKTKKLMRQGRLPPPPKFTVISRPKLTSLKGRVKPVKLSRITLARPLPAHVMKLQAIYLKRMRSSVISGKLPPVEIIRFGKQRFLWEGRHRFATVKAAGFKYAWAAEMRYKGKLPFAKVQKLFMDTHAKTLRRQENG